MKISSRKNRGIYVKKRNKESEQKRMQAYAIAFEKLQKQKEEGKINEQHEL